MTIAPTDTLHQAVRNQDWPETERLARLRLMEQPEREEYLFMLAISGPVAHAVLEGGETRSTLRKRRPTAIPLRNSRESTRSGWSRSCARRSSRAGWS